MKTPEEFFKDMGDNISKNEAINMAKIYHLYVVAYKSEKANDIIDYVRLWLMAISLIFLCISFYYFTK